MKIFKKKLERISLIISGYIFILNAYLYFEQRNILFGIISCIIGLCNLIALRFTNKNNIVTNIILNIFNLIATLLVSYDSFTKNTKALHIAWLFVSFMYFVVIIIFALKLKKKPGYQN